MRGVALVALVACSPPGIFGEVVTRGRHVELHADPRLPICAESIDHVDDFIEATADLLGVPAPDVTYYLYDGAVEGCRILAGDGEVFDCASGTTVYAALWPHYHEIVHTIARPWGRPPAFLVEGLAEGLGTAYPQLTPAQRATAELSLDSVDFYATNVAQHYEAAADFSIYLLRRFGAAKLRALSTSLLYLTDSITLRRRFEDITGNTLDTVIAAWRTSDPLAGPLQPLDAARCNAPPADSAADGWQAHDSDTCAVDLVGPSRVVHATTFRSFDVATPALYMFDASTDASIERGYDIAGCESPDLQPFIDNPGAGRYDLFPLAAGRHSIEVAMYRPLVPPDPIDSRWQLASLGPLGATCETAPLFRAPAASGSVSLDSTPSASWGIDGTQFVTWLAIAGATSIDNVSAIGVTGRVCNGPCAALASCEMLDGEHPVRTFPLLTDQPVYIELDAPLDSASDTFVIVDFGQNTTPMRGPSATARSRLPRSDWRPRTP